MKGNGSRALVTVKPEVARVFLPKNMHKNGEIDLTALADLAKGAVAASDKSLIAAKAIADGAWWQRWLQGGVLQQHIVESITHIRDISKVNLALSAICNDLAAANLEHASRIDANHLATNTGLNEVKTLTSELLDHLRQPRHPGLLDGLLPALGAANLADQDAMRGWLRSLSEAIDLQYSSLQANVKLLTAQQVPFAQRVDCLSAELSSLDAAMRTSLQNQKTASVEQLGLISLRLEDGLKQSISQAHQVESALRMSLQVQKAESDQQLKLISLTMQESIQKAKSQTSHVESMLGKSHGKLADALGSLNQHLNKHISEVKMVINAERASRDQMIKELNDMLIQRESAMRVSISDSNQRVLKKMYWAASVILIIQVTGFVFLSIKMGLWS